MKKVRTRLGILEPCILGYVSKLVFQSLLSGLDFNRLPLTINEIKVEGMAMEDDIQMSEHGDSVADAIAAVALILIFVGSCIFWVSNQ